MAPRRGPVVGGLGRAPLTNKYRNITNQRTVQGALRSGRPLTGSASGVRSISSVDAFNTLGQFFVGEALGAGLALGAAKVFGFAAPKIGRAVSGARPMTTAERSAAVTRAGRTDVGKIGPSIKPKRATRDWAYDPEAGEMRLELTDPWDNYDRHYRGARVIRARRGHVVAPDNLVNVTNNNPQRYARHTWDTEIFPEDGPSYIHRMVPAYMKKTLDWAATRRPLRKTASVKPRTRR